MFQVEPGNDARTFTRIQQHYEVERELADRLRNASRDERLRLYSLVYDELFQRVPDHPQLSRKVLAEEARQHVNSQMRFLRPLLNSSSTFLEIGAGDCQLSFAVAKHVSMVFAVDVSEVVSRTVDAPENFALMLSDGCSIPVAQGSVDVAYSNQLLEHLHPEDALEHVRNVYRALTPGGIYVCMTPNRLSGPHDVSRYFDARATGFHLKEYTARELQDLFRDAGFSTVKKYLHVGDRYVRLPVTPFVLSEWLIDHLSPRWRKRLSRHLVHPLLVNRMLATK